MRFDNVVLGGLLLAALLTLVLLVVVVSAARRGGTPEGAARSGASLRLLGAASLRRSFRKAVKLIEKNLATRAERYSLSWTLLLNDGAELPLSASGLRSALPVDSTLEASTPGLAWHFFDKGVLLDLRTEYLGAPDDPAVGGLWDDLLGLCQRYRPERAFDAIVLAVPCAALLQDPLEGQLALTARAGAIQRRLWLAQNRLALRFPIHLVIKDCEALPGFAAFGAALPEALRRSILGWASPHELDAPFRAQWVDAALDQVNAAVAGACDELCALEGGAADSSAYLQLPRELERMRSSLKVFCEELMRPGAYHEAFLLRGIYLTGDCSPGALLQAGGLERAPLIETPQPVFLHDLFERKVFAETGLVRSASQRLRRSNGRRLAFWAAVALPVAWACTLVVATVELRARQKNVLDYLQVLAPGRAAADLAATQRRAAATLERYEAVGDPRFYALSMPGSWPWFDDLDTRLQVRLEQAFAANAVAALSEAGRARTGALTGVARDPATGMVLENGQCTLPGGWDAQVRAAGAGSLNLRSLPEYNAMMAYLAQLDELDRALAAMRRLANPNGPPARADDLALAVRILLGKQLQGVPTRTALLYRAAAQRDLSMPSLKAVRQAARCTLRLAGIELYRNLFDQNPLLRLEAVLADSTRRLTDGVLVDDSLDAQLALWRQLRAALDEQKRYLVAGQGGWMLQQRLALGSAQDDMLARVAAHPLLGPDTLPLLHEPAAQGFARFRAAWMDAMSVPNPVDASAGLVWNGSSWAFTAQRQALHDAVSSMLAQAFMTAVAPARLPAVPSGQALRWDRARLERAAGLAEARKAFRAGPYVALPGHFQAPAGALADSALAAHAHAALAQALTPGPQGLPGAALEAERAGVVRIFGWLKEIGAEAVAAELGAALVDDAVKRLARLDADFAAAQVFMPRDPDFQHWQGTKGVMLDAFGGGDAAGLDAYLAQQQLYIDTVVTQAEAILAELSDTAPAGQVLLPRWQALAADLRRYRLKSPTSSRMALEAFISSGSADLELGNCIDKLGQRRVVGAGLDLFAERLQSLQGALLARCRELVAGEDQRRWQQFADAYNRDLGRRAPFVMTGDGVMAAAVDAPAADREAVGAALGLYERARAAADLAARDPAQPGPRAEVRRADVQLRRVRDLLAPLYPSDAGQPAGLDVAVDFRVNPALESGASNIIDWTLSVGAATAHPGPAARPLRWEIGMPVTLSLRFARDGAVVPRPEPGRPDMRVTERTVSYRFDDPWALLSFINAYRVGDSGDDTKGTLLRFEFPLADGKAPASLASGSRARVFLRLRVSAPGKAAPLAWPAVFALQVPSWQAPREASL